MTRRGFVFFTGPDTRRGPFANTDNLASSTPIGSRVPGQLFFQRVSSGRWLNSNCVL